MEEWAIEKFIDSTFIYLSHLSCNNAYVYIQDSEYRNIKNGIIYCDQCDKEIPKEILLQLRLLGISNI